MCSYGPACGRWVGERAAHDVSATSGAAVCLYFQMTGLSSRVEPFDAPQSRHPLLAVSRSYCLRFVPGCYASGTRRCTSTPAALFWASLRHGAISDGLVHLESARHDDGISGGRKSDPGRFGRPLSGYILHSSVHGTRLAGWQGLFIIGAIPALVLGVVPYFYLDDRAAHAK